MITLSNTVSLHVIQGWKKKQTERGGKFAFEISIYENFQTSKPSVHTMKWKTFINILWIQRPLANYLFRRQTCEFSIWRYSYENLTTLALVVHTSQ